MMSKIRADIFIPTSNRLDCLKQCLDSVNNQTNKNFNIFLVGLKPSEDVKKLADSYKNLDINYFIQKDKGIIPAANEAVQKANHDFFIRIDDDVILDKHWFDNVVKRFDSDKNIGGVTGPTCMSDAGIKSRDLTKFLDEFKTSKNPLLRGLYNFYFNFIYEGKLMEPSQFVKSGAFTVGSNYKSCLDIKGTLEVTNLEACNLSVRTSLLKKIGGFDTVFLKGLSEFHEADVALKIKNLGYKLIFDPSIRLQHNVEVGTIEDARPDTYNRIQNFLIFYFRFFPIKSLNQFLRLFANVLLQNSYYVYKFFITGSVSLLGSIPGTFVGIYDVVILKKHKIKR